MWWWHTRAAIACKFLCTLHYNTTYIYAPPQSSLYGWLFHRHAHETSHTRREHSHSCFRRGRGRLVSEFFAQTQRVSYLWWCILESTVTREATAHLNRYSPAEAPHHISQRNTRAESTTTHETRLCGSSLSKKKAKTRDRVRSRLSWKKHGIY